VLVVFVGGVLGFGFYCRGVVNNWLKKWLVKSEMRNIVTLFSTHFLYFIKLHFMENVGITIFGAPLG